MLLHTAFISLALLASPAFAAFGITVSGRSMTVDTDGGLVFTGTPSSYISSCMY